mgnify:CR=1 FL=1
MGRHSVRVYGGRADALHLDARRTVQPDRLHTYWVSQESSHDFQEDADKKICKVFWLLLTKVSDPGGLHPESDPKWFLPNKIDFFLLKPWTSI